MLKRVLFQIINIIITLLLTTILLYFVVNILPGSEEAYILGDGASLESIESLKSVRRVPLLTYIKNIFSFNFQKSSFNNIDVNILIIQRLKPTLILSAMSIVLTMILSFTLTYFHLKAKNLVSNRLFNAIVNISFTTPSFLISLAAMLIIAKVFNYFYIYDSDKIFKSLLLPSLLQAIVYQGLLMKSLKELILNEERKNYVKLAYAKGLKEKYVIIIHEGANILFTLLSLINQSFINLFSSSAAIESIFSIPGIGSLCVSSILRRDINTLSALIFIILILTSLLHLIEDILFTLLRREKE